MSRTSHSASAACRAPTCRFPTNPVSPIWRGLLTAYRGSAVQSDDVLAILCPGQGAQTAGFVQPWLDLVTVREELARLKTRAYVDLAQIGSDPNADVVDTAVAQPLL